MKTSLARCNECVVYHNWHRKGDWKKRFVKIVTGDFVDVPRKFLENNIRGQIPDEVNLDLPNGKTYTVQVSKEENGLIFQSGWAEFARTYELVQGDILLFVSSGSSCFEVRIFNQTGSEKELSCVAMKNTPCLNEKSMPHDNDMQSPRNERCGNMSGKRHTICKECAAFYYWHHMDKMRYFMVMMGVSASKNGLTIPKEFANNVRGKICDEIKLEVPDGQIHRVQVGKEPNEVVFRSGWDAFVSAYELKEGDTLLFAYTGNSHFKVQIFNVSGCDKLLSCVVKNNPMQSPTERTWNVNLAVITDGACTHSCILSAGWLDFVRDNNLKEGDICAFEVSKGIDRVITVHLLKNVVVTGHSKPTSQQQKEWTDPGYVVTKYTKLTCKQKKKVEEMIQAIKPETRIFVSIIHRSRAKLSIEVRYATAQLPREEQWVRLQLPGKNHTWKSKLYIGDKDKGKCYALQTGWKKFVDDNKLQDDDMCLFELLKHEELTMNVHIIRRD